MSKKSRKLIRALTPDAAAAAAAAGGTGGRVAGEGAGPAEASASGSPYEAFAGREWGFAFLPDARAEIVDEAALHGLMNQWRHGRATRTIGQALSDAYFALFTVVLLGAMVTNAIVGSQRAAASCDTTSCDAGRALIPWGVHFATLGLALGLARLFGPVLASAAEGFWLMDAPISRAHLLRGRLLAVVAGAGVVGAALAAVVAGLTGEPGVTIGSWAAATGLSTAGVMAWAAAEQSTERTRALRVARALAVGLGLAALAGMVAVSAGWLVLPDGLLPWWGPWALAAVGGAAVVGFAVVARQRLDLIGRARLTSGGSLVSGMQGAMFALDFGLARDILVEREAAARGHVRPVRGRGTGVRALVWRDLHRLLRFPRPLVGVAGAALVPYAVDAVGLGVVTPLLGSLALVAALVPTLGALRVLSRTGGLARSFPFATWQVRTATATVPAVLAVAWALAVAPALTGVVGGVPRAVPDAALAALAMAAGGLLGAVRWQTAKPVDFQVPMVATETGAIPPTLVFNLLRGFDMVALVTAPLLLGAPPAWSLGIAAVIGSLLFAGLNTADMAEEAKEQRQQLDAERGRPAGGRPAGGRPAGSRTRVPAPTGRTKAPATSGGTKVPAPSGRTKPPATSGGAKAPATSGGTKVPAPSGRTEPPAPRTAAGDP